MTVHFYTNRELSMQILLVRQHLVVSRSWIGAHLGQFACLAYAYPATRVEKIPRTARSHPLYGPTPLYDTLTSRGFG